MDPVRARSSSCWDPVRLFVILASYLSNAVLKNPSLPSSEDPLLLLLLLLLLHFFLPPSRISERILRESRKNPD